MKTLLLNQSLFLFLLLLACTKDEPEPLTTQLYVQAYLSNGTTPATNTKVFLFRNQADAETGIGVLDSAITDAGGLAKFENLLNERYYLYASRVSGTSFQYQYGNTLQALVNGSQTGISLILSRTRPVNPTQVEIDGLEIFQLDQKVFNFWPYNKLKIIERSTNQSNVNVNAVISNSFYYLRTLQPGAAFKLILVPINFCFPTSTFFVDFGLYDQSQSDAYSLSWDISVCTTGSLFASYSNPTYLLSNYKTLIFTPAIDYFANDTFTDPPQKSQNLPGFDILSLTKTSASAGRIIAYPDRVRVGAIAGGNTLYDVTLKWK